MATSSERSESSADRTPLGSSPDKTNVDSETFQTSIPPPVPPKDPSIPLTSPRSHTFGIENTAASILSRPPDVHKVGSIGRNAHRLEKLPSLQQIGKVYVENGGSPINKLNHSLETTSKAFEQKKPVLEKLLPVASTPLRPTQDEAEKLTNSLSPYTAGSTAVSPSTRLKLPLSAITRVDAVDKIAKGSVPITGRTGSIGAPAPRGLRQTIQIPTTDPTKDESSPHISASASSATVTPLITPHSGRSAHVPDQVKIVNRADLAGRVSPTGVTDNEHVKSDKYTSSWRDDFVEKKRQDEKWGSSNDKTRVDAGQTRDASVIPAVHVVKPGLHPLQHLWTLYYDTGRPVTNQDMFVSQTSTTLAMKLGRTNADEKRHKVEVHFEARLLILGEFHTVEEFGWTFGQSPDQKRNYPSQMNSGCNLHLFKDGIRPMYEEPGNREGGRWTLVLQNTPGLLDRVWQNLVCAMIGEQLDDGDDVCGAVISIRPKVQRIQIWLRKKNDFDTVERIGHRMLRILEIAEPNVVSALDFAGNVGPIQGERPHLQIGKVAKYGPRLAQSHTPGGGGASMPGSISRASSLVGSAASSRRNSPTQSGFVNPFAGPLGLAQPASPRPSSLRPGRG